MSADARTLKCTIARYTFPLMLVPVALVVGILGNHVACGAGKSCGMTFGQKFRRRNKMDYEDGSLEYEAFQNGYRQATDHEMRHGQEPIMPKGYSAEQARAWDIGRRLGYQDT